MIHPPALTPGATVGIFSPAGPVLPQHLEAGLARLRQLGYRLHLHPQLYARRERDAYLAGDDARRLSALHELVREPAIAAIVCARGGYGCMRLLPGLELDLLRAQPTLLVGFSDVTALHLAWQRAGVASLHGPVVKSLPRHTPGSPSAQALAQALRGARSGGLTFDALRCVRPGRARGRLIGGNLSVLCALLGTPWCPPLRECLVLVEDVGEADYRLDRLLTSLRLAGPPAGLILGEFTDCAGVYVEAHDIEAFVERLTQDMGCPVVSGFAAGHGQRNVAWPVGVQATLDASLGRLVLEADAVSAA